MENPINMDDLGENPLFSETSISSSSPSPWKVFFFDSNIIFNLPAVIKHKHALQRTLRFFWPPNLNNPCWFQIGNGISPRIRLNISNKYLEPTHLKNMLVKLDHLPPQFFGLKQFTKIFVQPAARQFLFRARYGTLFSPQKIAGFSSDLRFVPFHRSWSRKRKTTLVGSTFDRRFQQPDPGDDDFLSWGFLLVKRWWLKHLSNF